MIFLRDGGWCGDVFVHKFMFTNELKYYHDISNDDDANIIMFIVIQLEMSFLELQFESHLYALC